MIRAIHVPLQMGRRCRHQPAHDLDLTGRDGGQNRVAGSVRDQILDDRPVGALVSEAGGPADDVELVIVDFARDGFRSVLDEQLDNREVSALGREMQRECVIAFVADVRIGPAIQEQLHDWLVVHAEMQRRPKPRVALEHATLVDDAGMAVEDVADARHVSF